MSDHIVWHRTTTPHGDHPDERSIPELERWEESLLDRRDRRPHEWTTEEAMELEAVQYELQKKRERSWRKRHGYPVSD